MTSQQIVMLWRSSPLLLLSIDLTWSSPSSRFYRYGLSVCQPLMMVVCASIKITCSRNIWYADIPPCRPLQLKPGSVSMTITSTPCFVMFRKKALLSIEALWQPARPEPAWATKSILAWLHNVDSNLLNAAPPVQLKRLIQPKPRLSVWLTSWHPSSPLEFWICHQ